LALSYSFHQLTGQRFTGEHLGSFIAGTRRLEKKIGVFFRCGEELRRGSSSRKKQKNILLQPIRKLHRWIVSRSDFFLSVPAFLLVTFLGVSRIFEPNCFWL
jgi:hypothetical protein